MLVFFSKNIPFAYMFIGNAHGQQTDFHSNERFNYFLDVLNNSSVSEQNISQINTKYNEQERYVYNQYDDMMSRIRLIITALFFFIFSGQGLNLPDSPFASGLGGEIPTVI